MRLRLIIGEWLNDLLHLQGIYNYFQGVFSRAENLFRVYLRDIQDNPINAALFGIVSPINWFQYVILGKGELVQPTLDGIGDLWTSDYSKVIARAIQSGTASRSITEPLEAIGTLVSEPLFAILRNYAKQENPDHNEFLRAFYGYMVATPFIASSVSTIGEIATLGQVEQLGKPISDAYWTMGLGFMGWQGISPILTNGVLVPMERQVNAEFRQTRFNSNQALTLFQRNLIDYDTMVQALRWEGWRDGDIPQLIGLAYRNLSDGQLLDFHEKGLVDETSLKRRLRDNGWRNRDVELLLQNSRLNQSNESKNASLSTTRKAFKLRIISEKQFRQFLADIGYSKEAIALELNVLNFEDEIENKTLSVSQLKQAYNTNQITQNEALIGLENLGYSTPDAQLLFDTWQAGKSLRVLRVNQSTITKAMVQGVLSADEGLAKLMSIGYAREDAELIISTVNLQGGGYKRLPNVSQLLAGYQAGLLERGETLARLETHGFAPKDAELLVALTETNEPIETDENTILDAFLFGVFSEGETRQKLSDIGATQDFINARVETYKKRRARQKKGAPLSEVAKWLRHGLIDESTAMSRAIDNGLSSADAELFVQAVGLGTPRSLSPKTVEDGLLYELITPNEALNYLRETGLSPVQAQTELDVIQKRIEHTSPRASISSLLDAARKEIITLDQFQKKLKGFFLKDDDIATYSALAVYEPSEETTKLSKTDILKAYREDEIDRFTAINLLESKGYAIQDAELLIRLERKEITDTTPHKLLISGAIGFEEAIAAIESEGFSPDEIREWLDLLIAEGF